MRVGEYISRTPLGVKRDRRARPRGGFGPRTPPRSTVLTGSRRVPRVEPSSRRCVDAQADSHRYYKPDLVFIPIGGHFVMSPQDAAYATREYVRPKLAVPMHYGTFPVLKGTPQEYIQALGTTPIKVVPLNPGEALLF